MRAGFQLADERGYAGCSWQTRISNHGAQHLYDQLGVRETGWIHYDRAGKD